MREQIEQLVAQCGRFDERCALLEEKNQQLANQNSSLKDEIVAIMARIDALKQEQGDCQPNPDHNALAATADESNGADSKGNMEQSELSVQNRRQLVSYLVSLDPLIWSKSDQEIVAQCEADGFRYAKLLDVAVQWFRWVLEGIGDIDETGRWMGN
jgi:TolA-binding protein